VINVFEMGDRKGKKERKRRCDHAEEFGGLPKEENCWMVKRKEKGEEKKEGGARHEGPSTPSLEKMSLRALESLFHYIRNKKGEGGH